MAVPVTYIPKVTEAGKAAAIDASNAGLKVTITHIGLGTGQYTPTGGETALFNEVVRVPATGVMRPQPNQMRIAGAWVDNAGATTEIGEIGMFAGNVLFAVWSRAVGEPVGYKTPGVDFVIFFDLLFEEIPADSVNIIINPDVNDALSALVVHETAYDAHIQYLLRQNFANAHSLYTAYALTGTPDALRIEMPTETVVHAYELGLQIVFVASAVNTGAVTVDVEDLGEVPVVKNGGAPLAAGDLQPGAVYTLFFDGTQFQVAGGLAASPVVPDAYTKAESDGRFMPIGAIGDISPAGSVMHFARSTPPNGWLRANGSLVSRTDYAELFAVIGTAFGPGDGSTTFRLPDLRGEFIRGLDDGRGVDPGRLLGSQQGSMVQNHKHVMPIGERMPSGSQAGYDSPFGKTNNAGKPGLGKNDNDNYWFFTNDGSDYDGSPNPSGNVGPETRPRNIALLTCIKY